MELYGFLWRGWLPVVTVCKHQILFCFGFFLSLYGVYRSKKVQPCLLKGELLFSDAVAAYIPQSQYKTNNQMHTIANLLMI